MENILEEKFDVAVIGGGPAGMIAAGRAAELGAKVLLLEKNATLGRKLLITGNGRCNVTQAGHNDREFIEKIGKKGKFLFSALNMFGCDDIMNFLEERGVKLKVEKNGKVFPASNDSRDVLNALIEYMKETGVKIRTGQEVKKFNVRGGRIESVTLREGKAFADKFIICSGGKTYSITGSTGDGYSWAKSMGHKVIEASPALVPIKLKNIVLKDLQGLSLKNIQINILQDNKKVDSRFGEMIFTHFGLSGPIILDVSKSVGEALKNGKVEIEIDLKPALDFAQLDNRLQRDFEKNINKSFKNYLPELVPKKLIDRIIKLSGIDGIRRVETINREERRKIAGVVKSVKLEVDSLMGFEFATITSGGVDLKEIDSRTMQSRIIENLYFAGEVIDLDGPTGGYNLQICWSTGYLAGSSI